MPEETVRNGAEDLDVSATAVVGVVGTALLALLILGLQALYYRYAEKEYERKVLEVEPRELRQYHADQERLLHTYRWVDKERGVVAIPVERAMELLLEESGDATIQ